MHPPLRAMQCAGAHRCQRNRTCSDPKTGETNWDAVIDAEMARRKLLEDSPIPCSECTLRDEGPADFCGNPGSAAPPVHTRTGAAPHRRSAGAALAPAAPPVSVARSRPTTPWRLCTAANEDPVLFDTAEIPWWAWVRRFHLPEVRRTERVPCGASVACVPAAGRTCPGRQQRMLHPALHPNALARCGHRRRS